MSLRKDINLRQGSYYELHVICLDSEGQPLDLENYRARLHIRPFTGSSTLYDSLTTENGRLEIEVEGAIVKCKFPADTSEAYTWKRGVYDIEIYPQNNVSATLRIREGSINLNKNVTRG